MGGTHHAWNPIKNVERKLVASVGRTRISERVPLRIALLPALLDGLDGLLRRGWRLRPRSEPAAAGDVNQERLVRLTLTWPKRGEGKLTGSAKNKEHEYGDNPPIIIPQHSRSPRAYHNTNNILEMTNDEETGQVGVAHARTRGETYGRLDDFFSWRGDGRMSLTIIQTRVAPTAVVMLVRRGDHSELLDGSRSSVNCW